MHSTIAETENYALSTSRQGNINRLVRKSDGHVVIVDDLDTNILTEVIDYENAFDKIASSYTYIDPLLEKSCAGVV
jgi:L-rhamnose isomerase